MKREKATDPLTPDDVAERLSKAMLRCWRILMDVRQDPDLYREVRNSHYLTVLPHQLVEELELWYDRPALDTYKKNRRAHMDCYTSVPVEEMSGESYTITSGCWLGEEDCPMKPVHLHIAETEQRPDGMWIWFCRCGAKSEVAEETRYLARKAGDAHLAEANA